MAWLVDRISAISAINTLRGLGYTDAKLVYEQINLIMRYQYMRDEDIKRIQEINDFGLDFKTHLNFLRHDGIIQFLEPNKDKEEKEYELKETLKAQQLKEAIIWMESLNTLEQEMINRIVEGSRFVCSAT